MGSSLTEGGTAALHEFRICPAGHLHFEQPLFTFSCEGGEGQALVDSGATVNLISEAFVQRCRLIK